MRISDWSSDVCSSDLSGPRPEGRRPRCTPRLRRGPPPRGPSRRLSPIACHRGAAGDEFGLDVLIRAALASPHRPPSGLHLAPQECVILARLALALDELAHPGPHPPPPRPVHGHRLGNDYVAPVAFKLPR